MEAIVEIVGALVVIAVIVALVVIGIGVLLVIAAVVGIAFLVYMAAKAVIAEIKKTQEENERLRLQAIEEQEVLARQAKAEAQRQEHQRRELEKEQQRQRVERERLEQERMRQAQAEAARERLEAESDTTARALTLWNSQLLMERPSPVQINTIVEETSRMHSHCGKYLHVTAVVSWSGVALEWKAHTGVACAPQVIGLRGNEEMFSEWAFAGQHTAMLTPGRHVLTFQVRQGGQSDNEHDLTFEIFVPIAPPLPATKDQFKKAVDATAKKFISRARTIAEAKRKVNQTLTAEGNDPDEITVELSKLEVQIKDLHQEQE